MEAHWIFKVVAPAFLSVVLCACTQSSDSCDDLKGIITHSTIEVTGLQSVTIKSTNSETAENMAVDQNIGTAFSNLSISIDLSWIEEEHRFRATNTFLYSLLGWFLSPAVACSLPGYYEEYTSQVKTIGIFSDNDFNSEFIAGTDLATLFSVEDAFEISASLATVNDNNSLRAARSYLLRPTWLNGQLVSLPVVPNSHIFTVSVTLNDGRRFELRTSEFLIAGI